MIELKHCPFCGGEAKICDMDSDKLKIVACVNCQIHSRLFLTESEATEAWNRRVKHEAKSV